LLVPRPDEDPQVIYEGRAGVKMPLATHHLLGAEDDGPEPGSRWSALRTNDLDAGEDRRRMDVGWSWACIKWGRVAPVIYSGGIP
jgi:hypothetical protein